MLSLVDRPSNLRQSKSVNQTQVCIRAATEADSAAVHDFLAGLSADSQYQRFFTGLGSVSPSLVRDLVAATPHRRNALAMLGGEVIGHAMAALNPCDAVELGVVVAEKHRNQGLATSLIRTLIDQMITAGAHKLQLDVLCENQLVLDWIRRSLPDTHFERDGHTLTAHAPLDSLTVATAPAA
jgi:ribosomal protein S18 acetylase RimI-like enzyme